MVRSVGRVLFLNGASSSGKSSLARAIQAELAVPPAHLSSDLLCDGALPPRWDGLEPRPWWKDGRRRFFTGYHRCIAAMASAGVDVIADSLLEAPDWRTELASSLEGLDVWLVGVHCELEELERRERTRGDRHVGEARTHLEIDRIHDLGPYDYEVDTSAHTVSETVRLILASWPEHNRHTSVLFRPT